MAITEEILSSISWNGYNLVGNQGSIEEVKRLIHVAGQYQELSQEYRQLQRELNLANSYLESLNTW